MFEWDRNNLRKILAHRIRREEAEEALADEPIPIYQQEGAGEDRFVYYGETNAGRLLAVIVTGSKESEWRGDRRIYRSLRLKVTRQIGGQAQPGEAL
jgi:uncharacterized DUF497 family protein